MNNNNDLPDDRLADYFRTGIEPSDVPALFPLQRARSAINSLITVFNGTEAAVLARLLVLREAGGRGDAPFWTASELRDRLAFLDEAKLENIIIRLRVNGLLAWDPETARYSVSPLGRMTIAALSVLLKFDADGGELGYVTAQLAASGAVGVVSSEELQHLLSRLNELKDEFERAIVSGSERRILEAERRLKSALQWVDKGTEVLRLITQDRDLDAGAHRAAQHIGQVQSSLLRMSGAFQRALNKIESQRVHLGASGLSTSDVIRWLRGLESAELAQLTNGIVDCIPGLSLVLGDIALDIAEFELIERERPERLEVPLPPATDAPNAEHTSEEVEDLAFLASWLDELRVAPDSLPLEQAVPARDYTLSSYRLSLLALIGNADSQSLDGPAAEIARLPRSIEWTGAAVSVGNFGVARMSEGRLSRSSGAKDKPHGT
ncbi:MAG: hypothetical protein JWO52_5650 [Gammaproteobacteria bacterium]|nr:hypothetical protein [Gammaproteobacteria bacterium]